MVPFFQTGMGRTFFQGQVPQAVRALASIATELKRQNDREELNLAVGIRPAEPDTRIREYPLCPRCGGPVVCATMTSSAIKHEGEWHYHPRALSLHCQSGECNYDVPLAQIPYPAPRETRT